MRMVRWLRYSDCAVLVAAVGRGAVATGGGVAVGDGRAVAAAG